MKNIVLTFFALIATITTFGQWSETEGTFTKEYQRIRGFEFQDSLWVYDRGNMVNWDIYFNVDFFTSPGTSELFGVVLLDYEGVPQWFYNYIGDLEEGEDEYGEYGGYKVDILSKEDDGSWSFWQSGEFRHYGNYSILYVGNPAFYKFQYFEER